MRKKITVLILLTLLFISFLSVRATNALTTLNDGDLLKMEGFDTLYFLNNGKRDVVPHIIGYESYEAAVMNSLGLFESNAKIVAQSVLESYPLGKNLIIKAGANYLLKNPTSSAYYIVDYDNYIKKVNKSDYPSYTEVSIPDAFWANYAITEAPTFRIMTQSDSGDYIGQNKSWDFSSSNSSKITVSQATASVAVFNIQDFNISNMSFEFGSEAGKILSPGLYTPAKRFPFRDSFNGINISGDGRGCNTILGAFYVHEYAVSNGTLQKAAIDFVQICEPKSSDINAAVPKLYGSLRYNSGISDSCDSQGCAAAKKNIGIIEKPDLIVTDIIKNNNLYKVYYKNSSNEKILRSLRNQISIEFDVFSSGYNSGFVAAYNQKDNLPADFMPNETSYIEFAAPNNNIDNYVTAVVDYGGKVQESNENNNTLQKTFKVVALKPDLTVTDINVLPTTPVYGASFGGILVTIKNIGAVVADNLSGIIFNFQFYNEDGGIINLGDGEYMSEHPKLLPGESYSYLIKDVYGQSSFKFNYNKIKIKSIVDTSNFVSESNEDNNTLEKTITISGEQTKPDLVIYGVHLPSAADKRIIVEVSNAGMAATTYSKGVKVSVLLKNSSGALVALDNSGYQYVNNLSPNGIASATFNISGNLTDTMILNVWLDNAENGDSGFISESDENNNTLEKTITIQNQNSTGTKYSGKLIKAYDTGAIYRVNEDGKRDVLPENYGSFIGYKEAVMDSNGWKIDDVITVPQSEADSMPLGKNLTIKSGGNYLLNKYASDIYFIVDNGNNLKQVKFSDYGSYRVVVIPDAYFVNYIEGQSSPDTSISDMNDAAKNIIDDKYDTILTELKQLRDTVKEQQTEIKYLKSMTADLRNISDQIKSAINDFITYGVDANTVKLGAGERAAVINSYKAAFAKLPETEAELTDVIKIANGRFPSLTSDLSEKLAKEQFIKIYKR
ncbi:MAG: CARDB domain-containing protein, partial [bacterium]|nr:CARDB domain-containing protein [bacterium]